MKKIKSILSVLAVILIIALNLHYLLLILNQEILQLYYIKVLLIQKMILIFVLTYVEDWLHIISFKFKKQ